MATYPISVDPLHWYYGDDPKKKRRFETDLRRADNIARYINRKMETDYKDCEFGWILFGTIANALNLKESMVQNYLHRYPGSTHNSIEVRHPPKTADES